MLARNKTIMHKVVIYKRLENWRHYVIICKHL